MNNKNVSSFRDPDGFLFFRDDILYRQVNFRYKDDYDFLNDSGLYKNLVDNELLVPYEEVDIKYAESNTAYKVIKPETIPFISYPYEWCFSQLKDAALTTLRIQKIALKFGMSLKDASAYNVQFRKCKPIMIDSLSFEKYYRGQLWGPYRQFCQHFLAPLALMSYKDARLNQLLRIYIDGIPLDLATSLLPAYKYLRFGLLLHICLHAKSQKIFANRKINIKNDNLKHFNITRLINDLESVVSKLKWKAKSCEKDCYYKSHNYSPKAFGHKKELVEEFLDGIKPKSVWDFGANIGLFSNIASSKGIETVSFDCNHFVVESNYRECVKNSRNNVLPLLMDLINPSPGIGWNNQERTSLVERSPAEAILALALIHHLAISNNIPFANIANFFSNICKFLIIEFIPKEDSQVQGLLSSREDIFSDYNQSAFESNFNRYFKIEKSIKIVDSKRILYLMRKR